MEDLTTTLGYPHGDWAVLDPDGTVLYGAAAGSPPPDRLADGPVLVDGVLWSGVSLADGRMMVTRVMAVRTDAEVLVQLFGGFRLRRGDGAVIVSADDRERMHDLLVAVTALRQSSGLGRSEIMRMLWPTATSDRARDSLKALVRRLPLLQEQTGASGPLVLETPHGYVANRTLVACDVHRVFEGYALISELLGDGHPQAAGEVALAVCDLMLGRSAGGIPVGEVRRFPELRDPARRAEVELAAIASAAVVHLAGSDRDERMRGLLRKGLVCTPHTSMLVWVSMAVAVRNDDRAWAAEIYEEYRSRTVSPVSFQKAWELAARTRFTVER